MTSNTQLTLPLNRNWVAARIPYSDTMCLFDTVVVRDDVHTRCNATSYRDTVNSLRFHGQLVAVCGIEYAARVMTIHGALYDAAQARPHVGLLVSVCSIETRVPRPGTIEAPLDVEAKCIGGDGINVLYRFTVRSGVRTLLTDRAAVVLDASVVWTCFVRAPVANGRLLLIPALLVALLSPLAHADLSETKENTKQDTREATRKIGHATREAGRAVANAVRIVGHGVRNVAHVTKCGVKYVFKKPYESD